MHVVVLAGGVGGSKFVRGVLAAFPDDQVTVIGNTADDITIHGLRICPDLDTMMYTIGGAISTDRGWGREAETFSALAELKAYGVEPTWFGLGDRDIATHLVRTQLLDSGASLSQATRALSQRWLPQRMQLLPMSDDRVETHVVIADHQSPSGRRTMHFQEYWVRHHAEPEALATVHVGIAEAAPAPGVLEAIAGADLVLVAPSNPVVSIGPILGVPGVRRAIRSTAAPVIGFTGIIDGHPLLGMADKLLPTIDVECSARAVGQHYGARARTSEAEDRVDGGGILDAWVVHDSDTQAVGPLTETGLLCWTADLIMSSPEATARFILDADARVRTPQ